MTNLSAEIIREFLSYDPCTGALWWKHRKREWFVSDKEFKRWNTRYANTEAFTATDGHGYKNGRIFKVNYAAHRVIWCLCFGYWPDEIDHDDGDRSNNKLDNIYDVGRGKNMKNKTININNTSGVIGVYFHKIHKKYQANITVNYKIIHLGYFDTIDEAIKVRKLAEIKHNFHINHGRAA